MAASCVIIGAVWTGRTLLARTGTFTGVFGGDVAGAGGCGSEINSTETAASGGGSTVAVTVLRKASRMARWHAALKATAKT